MLVPDGGARSRWKALKAESRSGVEQAEGLLRSLQDRILQIESRRHKVSQLVQDLSHQVGLTLTLTLALHLHQHPQCTASALSCPPPEAAVGTNEGILLQGPERTAVM